MTNTTPSVRFNPSLFAVLVACAAQHVEDVETGLEDGIYDQKENADLSLKQQAVSAFGALVSDAAAVPAPSQSLPEAAAAQVAMAGELLIRAAAALGSLSEKDQALVRQVSGGVIGFGIAQALHACKAISPQIEQSLRNHPPQGFTAL